MKFSRQYFVVFFQKNLSTFKEQRVGGYVNNVFFFEADKTIIKNYHEKDAQHKKYGKMIQRGRGIRLRRSM